MSISLIDMGFNYNIALIIFLLIINLTKHEVSSLTSYLNFKTLLYRHLQLEVKGNAHVKFNQLLNVHVYQ